ncbi:MAG: hypothetical protein JSV38_12160 [Desulfobacterales bacterium]|nr:MAG: hypothetical protein JSV38_12160 [Desulfobacterales bacterium]
MKDPNSLHLKFQEHIDCFATADPLKEMSVIKAETDGDEAALKWLALAALHGVNNHAEKIVVTQSEYGETEVMVEYRKTYLPSPGSEVGKKIMKTMRDIIHVEGDKGQSELAVGIRDSSLTLEVKIKTKAEGEKLVIKFPR